ncbi:MAG TPA: hypothetical protein VNA25_06375 [Phycisphaerae bacterium]|nr:hypothetical protein [Phycisphaerae bacterium]
MRRGFSLVEVLISIVLAMALVVFVAPVVAGLIGGLGAAGRAIQTDVTLSHMLKRLREDVEGARSLSLPGPAGGEGTVLLIESDDGPIRYEVDKRSVVRRAGRDLASWPTAGATVKCRIWAQAGEPIALEVSTCVSGSGDKLRKDRLARTHVLFLGGSARRRAAR